MVEFHDRGMGQFAEEIFERADGHRFLGEKESADEVLFEDGGGEFVDDFETFVEWNALGL